MRQTISVKRSNPAAPQPAQPGMKGRLLDTLRNVLPGAWIDPKNNELITLYRLRYKMAMEEEKYDTAMIFLNKILELDPLIRLVSSDGGHGAVATFIGVVRDSKTVGVKDETYRVVYMPLAQEEQVDALRSAKGAKACRHVA